ncbi:MAG: hypothetical protein K2L97_01465 [Muribaculaceae bacterium]|nr:hypothetical protein [Muribaculaceae bacterium]
MPVNDLIQWICVGVLFVIIIVMVIRYIINLRRWSKQIRKSGSALPPCCSGNKSSAPSSPCAGCGTDCPLSQNNDADANTDR